MIDNNYVEHSSTEISRKDKDGNTYQIRRLKDGTTHEVLKNFPTKEDITESLANYAQNIENVNLTYYWLIKYDRNSQPPDTGPAAA